MSEHVTIKRIARQLDISVSTVSRALQDNPRISWQTRQRVQALARELKYVPSTPARNLRRGKTGVFAVVLPEIRENFFSEVVNGVEELALEHGYAVALYQSHDQFEREQQIVSTLASNRVDGVMLSVAKESRQFDHVQNLLDAGIPLVLFDRIPPGIQTHRVECNIEKGAYEATQFLARRGHRRVALLNGPISLVASEDRYRGYVRALVDAGLPVENTLIRRVDLSPADTLCKMNELLNSPNPPDAVLAFNDYVALDAMQVCRLRGLRINGDISFVSFANLPLTVYMDHSPLASVEQHPFQIGSKAVNILLSVEEAALMEPANSWQQIVLEPELIVRTVPTA